MLKSFFTRGSIAKRISMVLAVTMLVGGLATVASKRKEDPLLQEIHDFEGQVVDAFKPVAKSCEINSFADVTQREQDRTLGQKSQELIRLQERFHQMKKRIEAVSADRKDFAVEDEWVLSLAQVSARYMNQLRRLIGNHYRLAHAVVGAEKQFDPGLYDYLNLELYGNVGVVFHQQEKELGKYFEPEAAVRYMISHLYNKEQRSYERIKFAFTPQDKGDIEYEAISATGTREQKYAKLIHYLTTRSRVINHYAIQRMELPVHLKAFDKTYAANLKDPNLASCGTNFITFRQGSTGSDNGYYHSLLKEDRHEDYKAHVENGMLKMVLMDQPMISKELAGKMLYEYVFSFPEMKIDANRDFLLTKEVNGSTSQAANSSGSPAASPAAESGEFFNPFAASPQELAKKRAEMEAKFLDKLTNQNGPGLIKGIEDNWAKSDTGDKISEKVLLLANYVGDDWNPALVRDRITWAAWMKRKNLLIDAFATEAGKQKWDFLASKSKTPEKRLHDLSEKIVNQYLTLEVEMAWRNKVNQDLARYMDSEAGSKLTAKSQARRFDEVLNSRWNSLDTGVHAEYVRKQTTEVRKQNIGKELDIAWSRCPKCFTTSWKTAFVNNTGVMLAARAVGTRPYEFQRAWYHMTYDDIGGMILPARLMKERLAPFTPDQLSQYFSKKLDFWAQQEAFPDLQERAKAIQNRYVVKQSLDEFFKLLSTDFITQLKEKNIKVSDLKLGTPYLADSLNHVVQFSYAQFLQKISTPPNTKAAPDTAPKWEVYTADPKLNLKWGKELNEKIWTRYTAEGKRNVRGAIFIDANNPKWPEIAKEHAGSSKTVILVKPAPSQQVVYLSPAKTAKPLDAKAKAAAEKAKAEAAKAEAKNLMLVDAQVVYPFVFHNVYTALKTLPSVVRTGALAQLGCQLQGKLQDGPPRPKFDFPGLTSTYVVPEQREEVMSLYMDAMAMMGLSRYYFADVAANMIMKEMIPTKFSMKTFMKMESLLDGGAMERPVQNRLAQSVLDQKLLGDTLHAAAIAEFPLLAIQTGNTSDADDGIAKLAEIYQPGQPIDRARARNTLALLVSTAAANDKYFNLVDEACQAKPFTDGNPQWRNVFRASTSIRQTLMGANEDYRKIDEAFMKSTRTKWEVWNDRFDAAAEWVFYATLVVIAIGAIYVGGAGLLTLISAGSFTMGTTAALGAAQGIIATFAGRVGMQLTLKIVGTTLGKFIAALFWVQVLTMGYVNCFHLPPHVRYLLGTTNAETGLRSKVTADRRAVQEAANAIYAKQIGFVPMLALQSLGINLVINDVKTMLGLQMNKAALGRFATKGTESIVEKMAAKTLAELVETEGSWSKGFQAYLKQTGRSLAKNWHFSAVSSQATMAELNALMANRLTKAFPNAIAYDEVIGARIAALNQEGNLIKSQIDRINPTWKTKFTGWVMENLNKHMVNSRYWNFAMEESVREHLFEIYNLAGKAVPKEHVYYEVAIRVYLSELAEMRAYYNMKRKMLMTLEAELREKGMSQPQIIEEFLKHFTTEDIHMHHKLLKWALVQSKGHVRAFLINNIGTTDSQIREYKRMFSDYEALASEINGFNPPVSHLEELKKQMTADYALFGLTPEATLEDLKAAYKRESWANHPDQASRMGIDLETAKNKFQEIETANTRLKKYLEWKKINIPSLNQPKQLPAQAGPNGQAQTSVEAAVEKFAEDEARAARLGSDPRTWKVDPTWTVDQGSSTDVIEDAVIVIEMDPATQTPKVAVKDQKSLKDKTLHIIKVWKERFGLRD